MGRESAIQLADRFGGNLDEIWLLARRRERLEEVAKHLPCPSRLFVADLAKEGAFVSLEQALEEKKPQVKWLVNAAGFGRIGEAQSLKIEDSLGMVNVNDRALVELTQLVLPYLANNSRILQFASAAAFLPQPHFAVYAASKAFVLSYSRALNAELSKRAIVCTAVCPGPVKTEFFDLAEQSGDIAFYKKLVMAHPRRVVSVAIRDSIVGKSVSVYGLTMKAFWLFSKLLPQACLIGLCEAWADKKK